MRKVQYEPSFLISAQVPDECHKILKQYAKAHGVSLENAYREAIKFFAAKCVHTQGGRRKRNAR